MPAMKPPAALRSVASSALCVAAFFAATGCQSAEDRSGYRAGSNPRLIRELLESDPARFGQVLAQADELRLKIELAIVTEGPDGEPTLERHSFDAGPEYFYPASSVKTCAAIAAALRLRDVEAASATELGLSTPLRFSPLFEGESVEELDATHLATGKITLGHAMRKVFLVSDNVAFNHLYEFAGNRYLNDAMRSAGLTSTRILHRLSEFRSAEDQLRTPKVELLVEGTPVAYVPERFLGFAETNAGMTGLMVGEHYYRGGLRHDEPMSFSQKNYMSLRDLQDMHIMLLRPDVRIPLEKGRLATRGFPLEPSDAEFMRAAMAETPGASTDPVYSSTEHPDDYSKFLAPGAWKVLPRERLTIRDKVGRAYGFSTTNSEVVDEETGQSYFLAATLYTNPNATLNDDDYAYPMADQFFGDLGEVVTRHVFVD